MMTREQFQYFEEAVSSPQRAYELASAPDATYSYETLISIFSQRAQKETRLIRSRQQKPRAIQKNYERYSRGESLCEIAASLSYAPTLLARDILSCYLIRTSEKDNMSVTMLKTEITKRIRDVSLIEDAHLRSEIALCIMNDPAYSPHVEKVRRVIGLEYEHILYETLRNRGLSFLDEDDLRKQGHSKTPDVKLPVPIAVDGVVVNWIESKALFGDEYSHRQYLNDQFMAYVNRFGPGMVIYWFGFVSDIDGNAGILIKDAFPDEIEMLEVHSTAEDHHVHQAQEEEEHESTGSIGSVDTSGSSSGTNPSAPL
mmetsp:Transcript_28434/g.71414  ORF Transcript_28434/g.71414 Transcript_28434/m.71414 type:complete len:313 (-) Transcript_28434:1539-2477(-)